MTNLNEKFESMLESSKMPALGGSQKNIMALMLENQEEAIGNMVNEGTLTGDIAQFTSILMPLVRRTYPNLIANELVGVQPMTAPTGFIYSLTNRYTGDMVNDVVPNNNAQIVVLEDASGATVGTDGVVYIEDNKVLVTGTGKAAGDTFAGSTIQEVFSNEAGFKKVLKNYTGSMATADGEVLGAGMKKVGMTIERKSIEAKTRKLKGEYSIEMMQDLKAQHGLNAESELMSLMSYELQAETDREVIDFIKGLATQASDANVGNYDGRWAIEKARVLAAKIANEAMIIGTETRRGAGNVLLVSPRVASVLSQLDGYQAAPLQAAIDTNGTQSAVAGTLFNTYKVIIDLNADAEGITVLYKGNDARDAAAFISPYVGAQFTKITHELSGQPGVILSSRYALSEAPVDAERYARSFSVDTSALF